MRIVSLFHGLRNSEIFLSSISPLLLSQTLKHTKAETNHVLEGFNLFSLLFFFQYADKVFDEDNSSVRESSNDRLMRKKEAIKSREKNFQSIHSVEENHLHSCFTHTREI